MDLSDLGSIGFQMLPRAVRRVAVLLIAALLTTHFGPPLVDWFLAMEIRKTQATVQPMLNQLLAPLPVATP